MDSRKVTTCSTTFHAPCATWNVVEIKMEGSFHNVPPGISTLMPVKGRRLPLFLTTDHRLRRDYGALKPQTWCVRFPYGDWQIWGIASCTSRLKTSSGRPAVDTESAGSPEQIEGRWSPSRLPRSPTERVTTHLQTPCVAAPETAPRPGSRRAHRPWLPPRVAPSPPYRNGEPQRSA
jgi:hypothetical protein